MNYKVTLIFTLERKLPNYKEYWDVRELVTNKVNEMYHELEKNDLGIILQHQLEIKEIK